MSVFDLYWHFFNTKNKRVKILLIIILSIIVIELVDLMIYTIINRNNNYL